MEDTVGLDEIIILKRTLKKQHGREWTGSVWLSTGKPGAVVSTVMNFGLHKVQVTS